MPLTFGPVGLIDAWRKRVQSKLSKPDQETELPASNEREDEEKAAIERERKRRIEDKRQD